MQNSNASSQIDLRRLRHLGYITGFQIPPNTCGPGLTIFHYGTIIVGNATLGENCTLFPSVLIGKKTSTGRSANIGNNVYICSGTKIIGDITNIVYIADTLRTM